MATEELKIKISVDTSELKQGVNQAKQAISGLNDSTSKGIKSAVGGANASVEELKDTMQQIRNMDVASYVGKQFEKIKDNVSSAAAAIGKGFKSAGGWAKLAGKEFAGAFDFKNFDVGKDGIKGYLGSMVTAAKEAASSIGKATQNIGAAFRTMTNTVIESIGPALAKISLFAAAVASVAAIVNTFTAANQIKQLNAEAQKIGLSVNAYQEWGYVLEQVGVGADKLSDFIKTLSEEQLAVREGSEEMIRSFNELGLSANEVINMSQEDLFKETVKRLQNVRSETQRTSLAYQIFGEDAAELANVLRLTNSETSEMAATVHLLGNTISGGLLTKSKALSSAVMNLRMAWQGLTNTLAEIFMPIVTKVVEWLTKAIVVVNMFLKAIFDLDITPALSGVGEAVGGLGSYTEGLEGVGDAAGEATAAVEKLKKVTMGFDELNIVTNPNAAKKDAQSGTDSSGGGADIGPGLGDMNTDNSIFAKAQAQLEEFKAKIDAFIEKWKVQIGIIAAALAALSIANILTHLGQAIGLGDKFLAVMSTIKKLAVSAIVITLQYSLVNEFMDSYLDGAGFKEYLKGLLVAAIGTGVLYAMWGPAGLVIGLGVTAVASLKAVLDHGGITDVESLTVALTGLAAAIGAVSVAWKKLGIGAAVAKVAGEIGAFISLLLESGNLVGTLAAAFPGLANAITKIGGVITGAGSAVAGFATAIGEALGLSGAAAVSAGAAIIVAAITAIASTIYYAIENWEQIKSVAMSFFELNIAPKLEDMKAAWDRLVESVLSLGDAFANVGQLIWDALPEEVKEWLSSVWESIKGIVASIAEWFASIDWLESIGNIFETVGGIIFHVLAGVVAGAFSAVVTAIEGFVTAITGVVEIVTGVVDAIVSLFTGDFQGALDAVKQIGQGIYDVFAGLYGMTVEPIKEFVSGVIDWFVSLWDELVESPSIVSDIIDAIVEWFVSLPEKVFGAVEEFVSGILGFFQGLWDDLSSWFSSTVAPVFTKQYWKDKFDTIKQGASEKLGEVKSTISEKWEAVKSWFSTNVGAKFTKEYWKNKFHSIKQGASEKLNEVKSTITGAWSSIRSWFSSNVTSKFTVSYWAGKFNTIKDGAKSAFNGVISIVENAINGIINKINLLSWEIPDWVPVVGGDTFGFNFKNISIPRLAEGGITNGSTLANIGERGKEAVLPLEHNTQWMDRLADRIAARNSAPTKVVLQVGEKELGWATIGAINGITKQTGGLQLAL